MQRIGIGPPGTVLSIHILCRHKPRGLSPASLNEKIVWEAIEAQRLTPADSIPARSTAPWNGANRDWEPVREPARFANRLTSVVAALSWTALTSRQPVELNLKTFLFCLAFAAGPILATQSLAQKLVDPKTVAPEYRAAAEKRKAEQRQQDCAHKAAAEQLLPRERAAFLVRCLETVDPK